MSNIIEAKHCLSNCTFLSYEYLACLLLAFARTYDRNPDPVLIVDLVCQ